MTGKVINTLGQAVPSATVVIIGKPAVTSDAMGSFTISGVATPYDLATTAASGSFITIVKGVTRADPTITSFAPGGAPPNTGTITGSFGGSATVLPSITRSNLFMFESPETTGNQTVTGADAGYSVPVTWVGSTTTTGTAHGLQVIRNVTTQLPTSYPAYGTNTGIVLANGNTAGMKNISGTAVTAQLFSGAITLPPAANLMLTSKSFSLRVGNGAIPLGTEANTTTTFSYQAPQVASSTITFSATASGMSRSSVFTRYGLASNATGVNITMASPPQLSIPAAGATGIALATQAFSWAPMDPNGLYRVSMGSATRAFVIFTAGTSFVLPSTVELGLGTFPANTAFSWSVIGIGGGPTTTDQIVGPTGSSIPTPPTGDAWAGLSESRSFTGQ